MTYTRVYHSIPGSGNGSIGTNYAQSDFGYDAHFGRQNRVRTPGGTITRSVYDARGRLASTWVGTNDTGATDSDPTGGNAGGNNMVKVSESQYDGGNGGGDGNLTRVTRYAAASDTRVTDYTYDWRNRRETSDGEIDSFEKLYYDNLGRVVKSERYDTTANGSLIARSESKYDDRGRVYQSITYAVNPSNGTVGNALTGQGHRDAAGLRPRRAADEAHRELRRWQPHLRGDGRRPHHRVGLHRRRPDRDAHGKDARGEQRRRPDHDLRLRHHAH